MKNRKLYFGSAIIAGAMLAAGGGAYAATSNSAPSFQQEACVHFGQAGSSAGNVMDYDWNDSACPAGTYMVHLAQYPDVDAPAVCNLVPTPSPVSPEPTASPPVVGVTPTATNVACK